MAVFLWFEGPHPLTHRRPSTHAFVPFEHCGCLSARSIIGRRHENPWLTGLVLPLPYRHPPKGVCFSYPWLEPTPIDVGVWEERLRRPAYTEVRASLSEVGIDSALDLLSTYTGRADELGPWLEDAEINRDRNLRLQYLAGLGINRYEQDLIYRQMLSYLTYPEDLFVGPEGSLAWLRGVILSQSDQRHSARKTTVRRTSERPPPRRPRP